MSVLAPIPVAGADLGRAARLLFLMLLLSYAWFYQSGGHNEAAHFDTARVLAEGRGMAIDPYHFNSADILAWPPGDPAAHFYSTKAPGLALVAAPVLAACRLALAPLPLPDWVRWHLVCWLTTIVVIALPFALAGTLAFVVLARLSADVGSVLLAVVAVWLGSIAFPFATLFFSHVLTASLIAIAFLLLLELRHRAALGGRPARRLALCGLLLGWAPASEYPAIIAATAVVGYAVATILGREAGATRRLRLLGALLLPGLVGPLVLLGFHKVVFGNWFFSPYSALVAQEEGLQFPGQKLGLLGVHWPGLEAFIDVLWRITFEPQRGLFYAGFDSTAFYATAPVLLLAIPGLALAWRRGLRLEATVIGTALLGQLAFNACYGDSIVYWGGGASIGPRHLIAMLPLLALPLSEAARSRWRGLFLVLLVPSVFYMLLATAVEPRLPYEVANPARDFFLPRWLDGELGMARAGLFDPQNRWLTEDSVAGSVGKMLRLPGTWQLAPLMLLWLLLGRRLVRAARLARPRVMTAAIALFAAVVVLVPRGAERIRAAELGSVGLTARYWPNASFEGESTRVRSERRIDFDWSTRPPYFGAFSAEFSGALRVDRSGSYLFRLESDDGSWLEVDGMLLIDNGGEHGMLSRSAHAGLSAGNHRIRVRFVNVYGGAGLRLWWTPPEGVETIIPDSAFAPE